MGLLSRSPLERSAIPVEPACRPIIRKHSGPNDAACAVGNRATAATIHVGGDPESKASIRSRGSRIDRFISVAGWFHNATSVAPFNGSDAESPLVRFARALLEAA